MTALLTDADLAESFKTTERRIADWRREYNWPHERFGRTIRYTQAQFEQIIASHAFQQESAPAVVIPGQTRRSARRSA